MDSSSDRNLERRFDGYLDILVEAVGHADRAKPLRAYCTGLLGQLDRKSTEPIAAATATDPARVPRQYQSLQQFVADSPWNDQAVLKAAYRYAAGRMTSHGPICALLIDDSGLPKKGRDSVGVARQYCGQTGKRDNCQVAVSLSVANEAASLPVGYRLYLPESWANDMERRKKAKVPEDVRFQTKWQIALDLIDQALESGKPRAPVVADAGYGDTTDFRQGLTDRKLLYVVGIKGETTVWKPGTGPLRPPHKAPGTRGRQATLLRRDETHKPVAALALALGLPAGDWQDVAWREGTKEPLTSRFAAVRVRPAHRDETLQEPRPEEWLLIEWPAGEKEPTKFWLSTLPKHASLADLVGRAKLRWRIERDYEDLKGDLGLNHYEGRGWRGFHHHATLCIAAYAFLMAERASFPPLSPRSGPGILKGPTIPPGYRPRGARSDSTACADLDNHSTHADRSAPHGGCGDLSHLRADRPS